MKNWQQAGNYFFLADITAQVPQLPIGIYSINSDAFGNLSLELRSNEFTFAHKVYGKDSIFINRVLKTYHNTTSNLGVLLNGIKGTGKSVSAKLLCNQLQMPVIMVDSDYDNLVSFLTAIPQDVVVMLDEYEKIFGDSGKLLGVMDGIDASRYRRTFILTTNESYINNNMLNRPSRLRYIKNYGNLDISIVREIIDDILIYPEFEDDLIMILKDMTHITIDLVISIIKEINIHKEPASEFAPIFNVDFKNPHFDIFEMDGKTEFAVNIRIPYGKNVMASPTKYINHNIWYEDIMDEEFLIGKYKGFKDGLWEFETDEGPRFLIFRKTQSKTFYAYQ